MDGLRDKIISKLWSLVYDLLILVKTGGGKSIEEIEMEADVVEFLCRDLL